MKLNERQAALLLVIEACLPHCMCVDYCAPWSISTATLKSLEKRGLVELRNKYFWHLTDAGKAKCQEYEPLPIHPHYGIGRGAVCSWIESTKWRPTPTTGMRGG